MNYYAMSFTNKDLSSRRYSQLKIDLIFCKHRLHSHLNQYSVVSSDYWLYNKHLNPVEILFPAQGSLSLFSKS